MADDICEIADWGKVCQSLRKLNVHRYEIEGEIHIRGARHNFFLISDDSQISQAIDDCDFCFYPEKQGYILLFVCTRECNHILTKMNPHKWMTSRLTAMVNNDHFQWKGKHKIRPNQNPEK
jgi:hypothetical protein